MDCVFIQLGISGIPIKSTLTYGHTVNNPDNNDPTMQVCATSSF